MFNPHPMREILTLIVPEEEGKRPRMLKPIIKRSIESVMSVSPDDLKKQEPAPTEWQEHPRKKTKPEEKPDLFKNADTVSEDSKTPRWKKDSRQDQRNVKKVRFESIPYERTENIKSEPVPESMVREWTSNY